VQQLYGNTAQTQVFATLALPTVAANDTIALHPALLDIASSVVEQLPGFHTDSVPFLYQDLRLYRPLPNTLHVALTVNRHDEEGDSYAFTLYDMAGE
ncbi:polyketide synthase dehydratase domain-containing protein, partial [Escherichia coli]